jgi:hypothetical protein
MDTSRNNELALEEVSSETKNVVEKRGAFGRFWNGSHPPKETQKEEAPEPESGDPPRTGKTCENQVSMNKDSKSLGDATKSTEGSSFVFDRSYRVKSPDAENLTAACAYKSISDDDSTGCTELSPGGTLSSHRDTPERDMPRNVSFRSRKEGSEVDYASPLISPDGSPEGVVIAELKPICDPNVLRTLAVPSTHNGSTGSPKLAPRTSSTHRGRPTGTQRRL